MTDKKQKITKDMGIMEVVQNYPECGEVFINSGMHCLGCMAARFEDIEQGAKAHGMNDSQITNLIEDLNKAVKKE